MQLFLDVDGVLLNFEHAFVTYLNAHCGMELPARYEAESWDFTEVMEPERLKACWLAFVASEAAGRMAPLVDPARFNRLAEAHSVHLVTNFPQPHMQRRLDNLERVGFAWHSLDYCGLHSFRGHRPRTKAQVIADLLSSGAGALFVDDHPDNCLDVATNCPQVDVWLMSRRFNRGFSHQGIHRAHGWNALFRHLGNEEAAAPPHTAVAAGGEPATTGATPVEAVRTARAGRR